MRRLGLIPKAITRRPVVELRSSCHLQQRAPAADPHEGRNPCRMHSFFVMGLEKRRLRHCRWLQQLRPVVPDVADGLPDRPDAQDVL